MKKIILVVIGIFILLVIIDNIKKHNTSSTTSITLSTPAQEVTKAKNTLLGSAFSPAHIPKQTDQDIKDYFNEAAQIGSHVTFMPDWAENIKTADVGTIISQTHEKGMKFYLFLSPVALYGGRKTPSIPKGVNGTSFADDSVQQAYINKILEFASLKPDYLGLGTEVNMLAQNPNELDAYVELTKKAYKAVKEKYPNQTITISFQWDIIITQKQFDVLPRFKDSLDVYSFTSYPSFFKKASDVPAEFYSAVRKLLPTEPLGFSEIGWNSENGSDEEQQAAFYARLPELMKGAKPKFVTLGLLHDVGYFSSELGALNSVGVRKSDGTPKKSWNTILNLKFN